MQLIAKQVLDDLPEWFGIPESTANYIEKSKNMPFLAGFIDGKAVGFKALECFPDMWDKTNPCQIYVKYIGLP